MPRYHTLPAVRYHRAMTEPEFVEALRRLKRRLARMLRRVAALEAAAEANMVMRSEKRRR